MMRHIQGYVFIANLGNFYTIFGKNTSNNKKLKDRKFTAFEHNGLAPYNSLRELKEGMKEYTEKRAHSYITAKKLEMEVAETDEETFEFEKKDSLIAIMIEKERNRVVSEILFGPAVEGKRNAYPLPGAQLVDNGFQTFYAVDGRTAYKRARYLASEINRQGQSPATISTFSLEDT